MGGDQLKADKIPGDFRVIRITGRTVILLAMAAAMAGCSETGFRNVMGSGKYAPDETQVKTNQALTMPPDLQLKPPSAANAPAPQPAPAVPSSQTAAVTTQPPQYGQPVTTEPPQYSQQAPVTQSNPSLVYQPAPQQPAQQPSSQVAYQPPATTNQPPAPSAPAALASTPPSSTTAQDPYAKYGISKTHPDGTPKTKGELAEEWRKKKLEIERKQNPSYGTIFNWGNIWGE